MRSSFYHNKRIFITGHTGFKGSWLCRALAKFGAIITGYAQPNGGNTNLYSLCSLDNIVSSKYGDIRDFDNLYQSIKIFEPEIVIHLAAQPLVRLSYQEPSTTYEINVMGTVNILECVRQLDCVKSFLNVTTDKVYTNNEWPWGYREEDRLGGLDPYSSSKSCSELITQSYVNAFFEKQRLPVSTARAGNVIGGGDFSLDRIVPDFIKAAERCEALVVRNPFSTRSYQHVLDVLGAYLLIIEKQYNDPSLAGAYNIGPEDSNCVTTAHLADLLCSAWGSKPWVNQYEEGPHESHYLKLDCSKTKQVFKWKPIWDISKAVKETVRWYKIHYNKDDTDITRLMDEQIEEYFEHVREYE